MKKFTYELLAMKPNTEVFVDLENDKAAAVAKMNGAAKKGYSVLLIGQKDGKRCGVTIGPKTDWSKYTKVVEVTFGGRRVFTYRCSHHWEVGDSFVLHTPKGDEIAVVTCDAKYVHASYIFDFEDKIGYALKTLEDVIVKNFDQYKAELNKCKTMKQLKDVTRRYRRDKSLTEDEMEELEAESYGIYDWLQAKEHTEAWEGCI